MWQTSRVDPTLEEWEISKSELLNECKNSEGNEAIATCLEQIYLYPYRFWQILDGFSNLPTVEQNCILSADEVSALKHFTNNEAFSKKYRVYINDMHFNGFKVHFVYFHFGRRPTEIITSETRRIASRRAEAWLTYTELGRAVAEAITTSRRPPEKLISPSKVLDGLKMYYQNFRDWLRERSPADEVLDKDGFILKPNKEEWLGWLENSGEELKHFVKDCIIPLQQTDAKLKDLEAARAASLRVPFVKWRRHYQGVYFETKKSLTEWIKETRKGMKIKALEMLDVFIYLKFNRNNGKGRTITMPSVTVSSLWSSWAKVRRSVRELHSQKGVSLGYKGAATIQESITSKNLFLKAAKKAQSNGFFGVRHDNYAKKSKRDTTGINPSTQKPEAVVRVAITTTQATKIYDDPLSVELAKSLKDKIVGLPFQPKMVLKVFGGAFSSSGSLSSGWKGIHDAHQALEQIQIPNLFEFKDIIDNSPDPRVSDELVESEPCNFTSFDSYKTFCVEKFLKRLEHVENATTQVPIMFSTTDYEGIMNGAKMANDPAEAGAVSRIVHVLPVWHITQGLTQKFFTSPHNIDVTGPILASTGTETRFAAYALDKKDVHLKALHEKWTNFFKLELGSDDEVTGNVSTSTVEQSFEEGNIESKNESIGEEGIAHEDGTDDPSGWFSRFQCWLFDGGEDADSDTERDPDIDLLATECGNEPFPLDPLMPEMLVGTKKIPSDFYSAHRIAYQRTMSHRHVLWRGFVKHQENIKNLFISICGGENFEAAFRRAPESARRIYEMMEFDLRMCEEPYSKISVHGEFFYLLKWFPYMIAYFAHYECKNLTKAYLILLSNFAVYANDPEMKAIIQIIARNAKSMTQDVIIEFINSVFAGMLGTAPSAEEIQRVAEQLPCKRDAEQYLKQMGMIKQRRDRQISKLEQLRRHFNSNKFDLVEEKFMTTYMVIVEASLRNHPKFNKMKVTNVMECFVKDKFKVGARGNRFGLKTMLNDMDRYLKRLVQKKKRKARADAMRLLDNEINDEISEFVHINKLVAWLSRKNDGKWKPYCYGFSTVKDDADLDAPGSLTRIEKLKKMIRCRVIRILVPLYQKSPEDFETHFKTELWKARTKSDKEFQNVYERLQRGYLLNSAVEDTNLTGALENIVADSHAPAQPNIWGPPALIASVASMSLSGSEQETDDEEFQQFADETIANHF